MRRNASGRSIAALAYLGHQLPRTTQNGVNLLPQHPFEHKSFRRHSEAGLDLENIHQETWKRLMQEEADARARRATRTMKDATQGYAGRHPNRSESPPLTEATGLVLRDVAIFTTPRLGLGPVSKA